MKILHYLHKNMYRFQIYSCISSTPYNKIYEAVDKVDLKKVIIVCELVSNTFSDKLQVLNKIKESPSPHFIKPIFVKLFNDINALCFIYHKFEGVKLSYSLYNNIKIDKKLVAYILVKTLLNLHHIGIIHNDIKPGNIIINTNNNNIHLIDFSISKYISNMESIKDKYCLGTPEYMSPEAFIGYKTKKSDIWSLGVSLYEIFENRLPYGSRLDGYTINQIKQNIKLRNPNFHTTPVSYIDIIKGCLQKNEKSRASINYIYKKIKTSSLLE